MASNANRVIKKVVRTHWLNPDQNGYYYSIKDIFSHVFLQEEGACMAAALTDMLTYIHRIETGEENLLLSPNALLSILHGNGITESAGFSIISGANQGLEKCEEIPAVWGPMPSFQYQDNSIRYGVNRMMDISHKDVAVQFLQKNFSLGGKNYPVLGICHPMGALQTDWNRGIHTSRMSPFRWGQHYKKSDFYVNDYELKNGQYRHAVLITSTYNQTDSPDSSTLSLEIKNNWGPNWGHDGYAWVTLDLFDKIFAAKIF